MKPILPLLLLPLALTGCAVQRSAVPFTPEIKRSYEIGQVHEATTGSPMLRVGRVYVRPTYSPLRQFAPPVYSTIHSYSTPPPADLVPGQRWEATGTTPDGGLILESPEHDPTGPNRYAIHINPDGRVNLGWLLLPQYSRSDPKAKWPTEPLFEEVAPVPKSGSFEAELVYAGISNETIRLLYREYLDGLARPAFTQELTYDLKESREIDFKSLRLEVVKAGNSRIEFRVRDDGDLPWLPNQ